MILLYNGIFSEKILINIRTQFFEITKIKIPKIFKWLKNKNISDQEMLRTFNCGIGFCLIVNKKNIKKIKKLFSKNFMPYEIGYVSKSNLKINLLKSLKW